MTDLSLILPVYNEADVIKSVITKIEKKLAQLQIEYEIILVENGSTDASWKVVRKIAKKQKNIVILQVKKGYGNAIIAGIKKAKGEYICYMPSDGQIDLSIFDKLWKTAKSNKYDLVKIKRANRESLVRTATSYIFKRVLAYIFHTPLLDINGSPRILHKKGLTLLDIQSNDSFIDAEMTIKAHKLHWKIKEIPMQNLPRAGGVSTRSYKTYLEFIRNIWKYKTENNLQKWQKNLIASHKDKP